MSAYTEAVDYVNANIVEGPRGSVAPAEVRTGMLLLANALHEDVRPDRSGPTYAQIGDSRVNAAGSALIERGHSFSYWATMLTGGSVNFPAEFEYAHQGYTTADVLNVLPACINSGADRVLLLAGVNDHLHNDAAWSIANLDNIITQITDVGMQALVIAELPTGDAVNTGNRQIGVRLERHNEVHRWLLDQARRPRVDVANPYPFMAEPGSLFGDARVGRLWDGLHPNQRGAYDVALSMRPILLTRNPKTYIFPASNADKITATNRRGAVTLNPMMLGTGGTPSGGSPGTQMTGTLCDDWTPLGLPAGVSIAGSQVSITDPETGIVETWQQLVLSGTPVGSSNWEIRQQPATPNVGLGEKIYALGQMQLDPGAFGIGWIRLGLRLTYGSAPTIIDAYSGDTGLANDPILDFGYGGAVRTRTITTRLDTPVTTLRQSWVIRFEAGVPCGATVRFNKTVTRKILA